MIPNYSVKVFLKKFLKYDKCQFAFRFINSIKFQILIKFFKRSADITTHH